VCGLQCFDGVCSADPTRVSRDALVVSADSAEAVEDASADVQVSSEVGISDLGLEVPLDVLADVPDAASAPPCSACLNDAGWFRVDSFQITSLAGHTQNTLLETLNAMWQSDVQHAELNVLFRVLGATDTAMTVEFAEGARVGPSDDWCALAGTAKSRDLARLECSFESDSASRFDLYTGSPVVPKMCAPAAASKHTLPISESMISGAFTPGCDGLSGSVEGLLTKAAVSSTCLCLDLAGLSNPDAYKPSDEFCEPADPFFAGDSGGNCAGCNSHVIPMSSAFSLLGGLDFSKAQSASGAPAAAVSVSFNAVAIAAPAACPTSK
jgi:hypothetical protein